MHSAALENVMIKWESKEHTVEEKLQALEIAVYKHVGLHKAPEYYWKHGKFFERYVAGFITRYFWMLENMSFILLDPLHIFDILVTFIKTAIRHPIKLIKQILDMWTWYFTHGAFGLGMMTADALLAFITAASVSVLAKGLVSGVASAAHTIPESFISNVTYLTDKVAAAGRFARQGLSSVEDVFLAIQKNPQHILAQAQQSIRSGVSYGLINDFKMYADPFFKGHAGKA